MASSTGGSEEPAGYIAILMDAEWLFITITPVILFL
jgi:hypothetical protein